MAVISTLFVNSSRPARSAPTRPIEPFPQPTSDGEPSISPPAELPSRLPDGGLEVRDDYMTLTITENGSTCVTLVALGNTDCCEPVAATVEASTTTSAPPPASSSGDSANTALIIFGVTFGIAVLLLILCWWFCCRGKPSRPKKCRKKYPPCSETIVAPGLPPPPSVQPLPTAHHSHRRGLCCPSVITVQVNIQEHYLNRQSN
ncbi:hypothetical protein F5Y02DRAFT_359481 [Annulohypoxylon stygium]|nr:hypothetical protein F5Y02DRAFT_359481 [Annulohypoxylon stygium]